MKSLNRWLWSKPWYHAMWSHEMVSRGTIDHTWTWTECHTCDQSWEQYHPLGGVRTPW